MAFTLYYAPGACSLSPSIAMREAGIAFDLVKVDLRAKKLPDGSDYLAVNPKGYVPALRLPNGEILTEGAVMVQYIADQKPDSGLAPRPGTMERYRVMETLNFIATELHKGMSPLYSPVATEDYKKSLKERLALRWGVFAANLRGKPFVCGDRFTVADCYATYVLRAWQKSVKEDLARWPELVDYYARMVARPAVKEALAAESLEP